MVLCRNISGGYLLCKGTSTRNLYRAAGTSGDCIDRDNSFRCAMNSVMPADRIRPDDWHAELAPHARTSAKNTRRNDFSAVTAPIHPREKFAGSRLLGPLMVDLGGLATLSG